jgi:solute:Na+ symporter, SSS family
VIGQGHFLLWTIVAAYMAIITLGGAMYSRYMRTADAYFRAGASVPWWAAGITIYKANFTAYTFVAIASLVYVDGLSGLLLETGPALAFLITALVFATRWRRLNLTSPPEYLEARFNPATRQTFSILGIATAFIASGTRLYAVCKLVEAITGLPLVWTIVIAGAAMITYTMLGGLCAVVVTDILQFIILFLAVIPMFVSSVASIFAQGSWAHFVALIPPGFASFPHPVHGRTLGWLLAFWASYLLDYNGDWGIIQMLCSTPNERESRKAAFLAMALAIPHAFLLLGPCFIARVLWPQQIANPHIIAQAEMAYGRIAMKLLPPGMIGVVAAAMLAATMSTLSVGWNVRSTSFVNDLYVRFLRPHAGDREQILVGRIALVFIGGAGVAIALVVAVFSSGLFALAQALIGFVVIPVVLPLLLGLLVRNARSWAGIATMLVCLAFAFINRFAYGLLGMHSPLSFEHVVVISIALGCAVMFGSALAPQSEADTSRIRAFYRRLETPVLAHAIDRRLPAPLGVIGSLTLLVGMLMSLLGMVPQGLSDRFMTLGSAAVLIVLGILMRRHRGPARGQDQAPEAEVSKCPEFNSPS